MGIILSAKKMASQILRKTGLTGKEFQLLPNQHPVPNLNNTYNPILALFPRVTHPTEYAVLGTLAGITQHHILEIGSYLGYSACIMASAIGNNRKIYAVDNFSIPKNWEKQTTDNWIYANYSQWEWAHKNSENLGLADKINFIKSNSKDYAVTLKNMADRPLFDLMFIDGDHTYEGCLRDFSDYYPMLEKGGFIIAHDYNSPLHPGVSIAVHEFVEKNPDLKIIYLVQSMLILQKK